MDAGAGTFKRGLFATLLSLPTLWLFATVFLANIIIQLVTVITGNASVDTGKRPIQNLLLILPIKAATGATLLLNFSTFHSNIFHGTFASISAVCAAKRWLWAGVAHDDVVEGHIQLVCHNLLE